MVWNELISLWVKEPLMLIWSSLTQRWAGLSLALRCPRALTPSPLQGFPCLGAPGKSHGIPGQSSWRHWEDHRSITKTAEGFFWPFALYLIACFFKERGFFFPSSSLVFSPAIPMRHSFLWVIHTIKKLLFGSKFCSHAWNQHFFSQR